MINSNIKRQQQQTTGLIQRLSNNIQLLSIGVIVSEKFCFRKCLYVFYKFALHGQRFSCQTGKGNRAKHRQFFQGVPVWRMLQGSDSKWHYVSNSKYWIQKCNTHKISWQITQEKIPASNIFYIGFQTVRKMLIFQN